MLQRFYINLTPELSDKLEKKSRVSKKPKSEIARQALEIGLEQLEPEKSDSAQALLNLAHLAEKIPTKGKVPKDAIQNLDFYTWGGEKRE